MITKFWNSLSPDIQRFAVNFAQTFIGVFCTTVGLSFQNLIANPSTVTVNLLVTLIAAAAVTAAKAGWEGSVGHVPNVTVSSQQAGPAPEQAS